jgi:hypothetical protein
MARQVGFRVSRFDPNNPEQDSHAVIYQQLAIKDLQIDF